ncbi:hypothetical protein EDB81DRAFT_934149 [Dactylonectria macrodidyma]|uniref:Peptidase S8/S53 domain-containing protein n=1 Tax=Dactylonectria macrodidyma TaxID=307937 RepID=A0A9P9EX45_9HYPO|nr:hypothetical protein EDB81DRAFT_934149 [Dactylonectria macrodidyma]
MANVMALRRRPTFEDPNDSDDLLQDLLDSPADAYEDQDDVGGKELPLQIIEWHKIIQDIKEISRESRGSRKVADLASKLETRADVLEWTAPNGFGFLHYLLQDGEAARCCQDKVIMAILQHDPDSIERAVDGDEHPLTLAIINSYDTLTAVMIYWLQNKHLTRLLRNDKGEGKRCIKAAFDALRSEKPLKQLAACKLVGWATESMLKGVVTEDNLSPLQVAVMFDQGYVDAKLQPKLVKLLLKRYEGSIHDQVSPGRYRIDTGEIVLKQSITVYEWHKRTADRFKSARKALEQQSQSTSDRNSQGNTTSQRQGQRQQGRDTSGWLPVAKPTANLQRKQSFPHPPADGSNTNSISVKVANNEEEKLSQNQPTGAEKEQQVPGETKASKSLALGRVQGQKTRENGPMNQEAFDNLGKKKLADAEEASKEVKLGLQESYLRATILTPKGGDIGEFVEEDETKIKQFFANDMQNVEIGLHLGNQPQGEPMTEAGIRKFFKDTKFNSILAYVSLPQAPVKLSPSKSKFAPPQYRDERLFYFHWLHEEKKVNKILKLIVDDTKQPHRDEVIEEAIRGLPESEDGLTHDFKVEILKWRKIDLDPTTILQAAPNVREIHLDWSGNNVALRGWSALDGLPQLEQLRQVHLTYTQDVESTHRTARNVKEFKDRLSNCRAEQNEQAAASRDAGTVGVQPPKTQTQNHNQAATKPPILIRRYPEIEVIEHPKLEGGTEISPLSSAGRTSVPKHKWINCMREFVSFIPDLPNEMKDLNLGLMASKRVTVALIDDGVDLFTSGLAPFSDRFIPGVSFDRSSDGHSSREWSSRGGHGTLMAKLILAVCPYADIITYRVLMRPDKATGMLTPDAQSAAKAIKDAVERDVDIISMSWTVSRPADETDDKGFNLLKNIMHEAVGTYSGNKSTPLLFCAAADDGIGGNNGNVELPSNMNWRELFCIGAATNALQTWVKVTNPNERHFFFPGVDVPDLRQNFQYAYESPETDPYGNSGSSIACALAAGQAALILHCVKLGIYYTKRTELDKMTPQEKITEEDLKRVKRFEPMRAAFEAVCTENLSNHKVSYPAQRFERATDSMRKMDERGRLVSPGRFEPVASLVRNLIGWRDR